MKYRTTNTAAAITATVTTSAMASCRRDVCGSCFESSGPTARAAFIPRIVPVVRDRLTAASLHRSVARANSWHSHLRFCLDAAQPGDGRQSDPEHVLERVAAPAQLTGQ